MLRVISSPLSKLTLNSTSSPAINALVITKSLREIVTARDAFSHRYRQSMKLFTTMQ